ncbi:PepSY-associated TM helix domain-containing protein [Granulicella pectinivorans]|uniref:PepSY-associated TM helix domain-containing protein n=1 Tax=Granulicella pectinivorans TaxID=474950 RepID=UPI001C312785|nr:PepSY-associated TM helix domain-containing protein [Granulicella pectinivorans]
MRKQTAIVSRWLHIYLSMVSFAVILFFAVTGLTLNHAEWFANQQRTVQRTGSLPHDWLRPTTGEVGKLEIAERLRSSEKLHGEVSDFRVDDQQVAVSFKAPGYAADAFIDRDSNHYDLTITSNGFVAVMNDLHKGRDAGKAWGWVIDVSAVLLTLVSLTGLLLLFFVYKRRTAGLIVGAIGAVLLWIAWARFVP